MPLQDNALLKCILIKKVLQTWRDMFAKRTAEGAGREGKWTLKYVHLKT